MLSELLPQDQNGNCRGPEFATPKYAFGDINYFKLVTFFFLKLALFKKTQDSKEPVTLPLYMLKEIQIEKPASGRELKHIHLNAYELSVAHRSTHTCLVGSPLCPIVSGGSARICLPHVCFFSSASELTTFPLKS